jgi:hypothetical protein
MSEYGYSEFDMDILKAERDQIEIRISKDKQRLHDVLVEIGKLAIARGIDL